MREKNIPKYQKALNLWAIILIVWSIYRAKFKMPEWFDEFIAKPMVFVLPVYYYIVKKENKDFLTEIYLKSKLFISDIFLSLMVVVLFFSSAVTANYIKFNKLIFFKGKFEPVDILVIVVIALATAISEEILSRGFVLKKLYEESKNVYTASFLASILFFFLHVPILFTNPRISGNTLLIFMATDMILSLANSYIFLERKSLVLPIMIHALYNITTILFI
jgi:membrane protease YdiL (CAAX protease family)